jgi:outer membrane protein assembly factor BamB
MNASYVSARRPLIVPLVLSLILAACGAPLSSGSPSGSSAPASSAPAATASMPVASPPGPPATADDWPFFRGDAARTGEGGSGPKGKPVQLWQYHANGSINGAVVIAGDLVYASSDDDVLHALDIDTGMEKWHFNPVNPPVSEPAYADGVIYAFDGAGTLFALDAKSGDVRWHAPKPLVGTYRPTISDGTLYLGTGDGAIVAVDVTSGAELWRYSVASQGGVHRPAFADGIVYAGSDTGGLVAVDVATHELTWHWDTGTDITGSVVVAGGIAYIGGVGDSVGGKMSALDAKTGRLRWQLDRPFGAPAVADGVAFVSDQVGGLQARDTATGTELWGLQTERAQLSVAQGVVYVPVNAAHRVDAFDAATGARLWQFPVDGGNSCCVAVAHGAVFVATESGSLYKIGGDGSTIQPGPTPPPLTSARPRGDEQPGMILDRSGSGYVAELGSDLVEKFQLLPPFAP